MLSRDAPGVRGGDRRSGNGNGNGNVQGVAAKLDEPGAKPLFPAAQREEAEEVRLTAAAVSLPETPESW